MLISVETAPPWQTISVNDRRKFQKRWLCTNDGG